MTRTLAEINLLLWSKRPPSLSLHKALNVHLPARRPPSCSCRRTYVSAQQQEPGLISWVRREGGYVHPSLRLIPSESSGLGLISTQSVPSGTPLICLPHHLPLGLPSPHHVPPNSADSALLELVQHVPEELWALRLGLKLLMERAQESSFWWPYIRNLPQRFNVPIFFSGDEIASLQYAPVIYQVKKRCKVLVELVRLVESVTSKLSASQQPFRGQAVDAGALGWAMAAVSSRAFQVVPDGQRVLLPLIDMCNHSFTPNAQISQQEKKEASFIVVAKSDLQAGTNVLLSYGQLSNDQLLLDYGFVVPQNAYDYVELRYDKALLNAARQTARLQSDSFSQYAEWQWSILESLKLEGSGASVQVKVGGPHIVEGRLLAAFRVVCAKSADAVLDKDIGLLQEWGQTPLGTGVESGALQSLLALCALVLGHFPTAVAEDEMLLKKNISDGSRLALEFRVAKKQLLVDCIKALTGKLNALHNIRSGNSSTEAKS